MARLAGYAISFGFIMYMTANMSDGAQGWGPFTGWLIGITTVVILGDPPSR